MKPIAIGKTLSGLVLALGVAATQPVWATDDDATYAITITNLTAAQVVTPPLVVTHDKSFSLFEPGAMASEELAILAESGNPGPLADRLGMTDGVERVATGDDVVPPGDSATLKVGSGGRYLSFAAMLALTNDAFAAVRGVRLPLRSGDVVRVLANAYDAGSEGNNELMSHVPGLGGMARDEANAEGFVHIHRGVHGGGDLAPETHDWRNPVVMITIERVMD